MQSIFPFFLITFLPF